MCISIKHYIVIFLFTFELTSYFEVSEHNYCNSPVVYNIKMMSSAHLKWFKYSPFIAFTFKLSLLKIPARYTVNNFGDNLYACWTVFWRSILSLPLCNAITLVLPAKKKEKVLWYIRWVLVNLIRSKLLLPPLRQKLIQSLQSYA